MAEKVAIAFLVLLVAGTIFLCFAINMYLGLSVLLLTAFSFWFYLGVKKRKVNLAMAELAEKTGLRFEKSLLKYGKVKGTYRGMEVEIAVYSDANAFGGSAAMLSAFTGEGALAALEIRNFTGMKIKHSKRIARQRILSPEFPLIAIDSKELKLMLPHVSSSSAEMRENLELLCEIAWKEKLD